MKMIAKNYIKNILLNRYKRLKYGMLIKDIKKYKYLNF